VWGVCIRGPTPTRPRQPPLALATAHSQLLVVSSDTPHHRLTTGLWHSASGTQPCDRQHAYHACQIDSKSCSWAETASSLLPPRRTASLRLRLGPTTRLNRGLHAALSGPPLVDIHSPTAAPRRHTRTSNHVEIWRWPTRSATTMASHLPGTKPRPLHRTGRTQRHHAPMASHRVEPREDARAPCTLTKPIRGGEAAESISVSASPTTRAGGSQRVNMHEHVRMPR